MKCFECDGQYKKKTIDYNLYSIYLGKVKALICDKCNDTVFNSEAQKKIEKAAKKIGIWGIESRTKVGVVGNSLDVKINKRLAEFTGLKKGTEVSIYPESKKRLIVEID